MASRAECPLDGFVIFVCILSVLVVLTAQFDHFGPKDFKPGHAVGAPDHPHRGQTTVSYILSGEMEHKDSAGHRCVRFYFPLPSSASLRLLPCVSPAATEVKCSSPSLPLVSCSGKLSAGWVQWMVSPTTHLCALSLMRLLPVPALLMIEFVSAACSPFSTHDHTRALLPGSAGRCQRCGAL